MTDQKSSKERADTGAQRDLDASNREGDKDADDTAEEDRESQHDEVDR